MKETLQKMGLSEEQISFFMKEEVNDKYIPKPRFNEVIAERDNLKRTAENYNQQLEDLKRVSEDSKALKNTITELQSVNKANEEKFNKELQAIKIASLADTELANAGAINVKVTKTVFSDFLKDCEFDNEKILGLSDKIKEIKAQEEYKHLFKSESETPKPLGGFIPINGNNPADMQKNASMTFEQAIADRYASQNNIK